MSLVVQVAGPGGGGAAGAPPPNQPQKGVVITATSVGGGRQPPPAHVTTPFSFHEPPQHVVQGHPQPAPAGPVPGGYHPRHLPLSPGRPGTRVRDNHRILAHHPLPTQPLPSHHLPLLSPSPAHTILATSVNSPSLIPQNIPSSYMPRLPIHLTPSVRHRSPLQVTHHTQPPDNNILPPHVFKKLTRPSPNITHPDDDIEVGENLHHPRRSLMSPKHNKKSLFNNLALQDHNYCAAPPPSPPRSPTPPISPYTHGNMGVSLPHQTMIKDTAETHSPSLASGLGYNLTPSSPGLAPSVGGYPSPHYTGSLLSPRNRLKQSLEDAGVGPMTPLQDSDNIKDKSTSDVNMEPDGGEETETAPEADDDNQDEPTRCICGFLHDDGFMIQCDKCGVWQHVDCMGLDKNNIPDTYLCELCSPRPVDRKRAKALQRAREKELMLNRVRPGPQDSSEDEKTKTNSLQNLEKNRKFSSMGRKFNGKKALEKKLLEGKKLTKKPHKQRRAYKDGGRMQESSSPGSGSPVKKSSIGGSLSPRKNVQRKSLSATDAETEPENETSGETLSLRSWIDNYEEAVTNHYSPELRARLLGAKLPSNFFKPKDVSGIRCNVSLRGNGLKVLTANSYIPSDTPVIECRGKYMLNNPGLIKQSKNNPYVLQHKLSPEFEVLVDGTTYGNDSRFCRRASSSTGESNAIIRHHVEKGSLHLYIVASKNIEKNHEILLPPLEKKNGFIEEEMSIADELREIKKASSGQKLMQNGNVEGGRRKISNKKRVPKREIVKKKEEVSSSDEDDDVRAEREARIAKEKERLARQREEREKAREENREKTSPRKTRSAVATDVKIETEDIKEEIKEELIKQEDVKEEKQLSIVIPDKEEVNSMMNSPSVTGGNSPAIAGKSPGKPSMGLPDQSGLIVGVNTINYDVSFRNKTKTREERKMEMIMKAFEAMEKNEARKRNDSDTQTKPEKKRRRSNSTKTGGSGTAGDSALDQSSADEGYGGGASKRRGGGGGRSTTKRGAAAGSVSASRRRSRAKSGDSSAVSETETERDENTADNFKYPGHRASEDHDDDVSRQYIRGSRSPPGIANHLLRSAKTDKGKDNTKKQTENKVVENNTNDVKYQSASSDISKSIGCSAKKRWLMAAMSVDMSEDVQDGAGASPAAPVSPEPDYTPLKKRRLADYSNDASEDVMTTISGDQTVSDKIKSLPNGLKKRLISNLVLEAVLDKAMEDYKPETFNDENNDSNNEDTNSPFINDVGEDVDETDPSEKPKYFKDRRKEAIYKAEMDLRSNVSSESEEAQTEIQCKELYVPVKKCPVPEPETPETTVSTSPSESVPAVPDIVPDTKEVTEDEEDEDVPSEEQEFCSTPVQDEHTTPGDPDHDDKTEVAIAATLPPVPSQHCQFKSFFSTDLSVEDIDRQLEAKRSALVQEAMVMSVTSPVTSSPASGDSRPGSAHGHQDNQGSASTGQPANVKKRVSLADYKRRKQQEGVDGSESSTPTTTPTTPNLTMSSSLPPLSLPSLPSLPGLDTFKKNSIKESNKNADRDRVRNDSHHSSATGSRSPSETRGSSNVYTEPEPPREDLTERLRKEFGLNIDESDEADTDGGDGDKESNVKEVSKDRKESSRSEKSERREPGSSSGGGGGGSSSGSKSSSDYNRSSSKYNNIKSRESSHSAHNSDKNYKYSDKRDYRDSRDSGYRDKSRDSRHYDKSRHGSRRPSHPSSPSGSGRGMGLMNGGGTSSRRHTSHQSPSRRSSQDSDSRYSSSHTSGSSSYRMRHY